MRCIPYGSGSKEEMQMSMIKSKKGASAPQATKEAGKRESSHLHVLRLSLLGLFAAIVLLMSFTPLGYLRIGALSVSFLVIPVAAGAIMLGPWGGLILGTLFGFSSFAQAFVGDAFAAMLLSINPICYAIMCIVPRVLTGLFAGLVSKGFARSEKTTINTVTRSVVTSLLTPVFNTVMFMGSLVLFFWNDEYIQGFASGKSVLPFIIAFVGVNGLLEIAASLLIGTAVGIALIKVSDRMTGRKILW
ncbi:MAG: ECF transporter S component [Ruminococcaceae bacterium]|nr:ECF transporter S component [Oscillospiraceae bacterium]